SYAASDRCARRPRTPEGRGRIIAATAPGALSSVPGPRASHCRWPTQGLATGVGGGPPPLRLPRRPGRGWRGRHAREAKPKPRKVLRAAGQPLPARADRCLSRAAEVLLARALKSVSRFRLKDLRTPGFGCRSRRPFQFAVTRSDHCANCSIRDSPRPRCDECTTCRIVLGESLIRSSRRLLVR